MYISIINLLNIRSRFLICCILLGLTLFNLPACFAETMDKSQIIETIKYDNKRGLFYRTLPLTMQLDKDIALAAVKAYPYVLQHFDISLKADKDIAMAAVNIDGKTIRYLDETLINDPVVALAAMKTNGSALKYLNESNRSNKKIVMAATNQYSMGFRFASSALRDDKDVVLTAVRNNGQNLQYASARLRKDRDVVMAAVKHRGHSIKFAHESMHEDINRLDAYRDLFKAHVEEGVTKDIRDALQTGTPLGNDFFRDKIEKKLKSKVGQARRGLSSKRVLPS